MGSIQNTEKEVCSFCRLPKAVPVQDDCNVCQESVCRNCVQMLHEDDFRYANERPEILSHARYCPRCFDEHIIPAREAYTETLERAKNVGFWTRTYRGTIPIIKRGRLEIEVKGGRDRDDILLRLGFRAAELGFNGLVHGVMASKKLRNHGYQKMEWEARALPVKVDQEKVDREEWREAHWRILSHR